MKLTAKFLCLLFCLGTVARAEIPYTNPIRHVVIVFQENRTPDNLFHGFLSWPGINPANYDLASSGVNSKGQVIPLGPVALGNAYDLSHSHSAFVAMYDGGKMDGADKIPCSGICLGSNLQFKYVDNTLGILDPYFTLAANYGFANRMFQSSEGPTYPAHQFIFGGTSAPSAAADAMGQFVSENPSAPFLSLYIAELDTGCLAPKNEYTYLIDPTGVETKFTNNPRGTFCFSRNTMGTLLDSTGYTWKYYTPPSVNLGVLNPGGGIWTAPASIREVCQPNESYTECAGQEWSNHVDLLSVDVLKDIQNCQLPNVSWVMPNGLDSDHAGDPLNVGGPSWVGTIVNAIGSSTQCEGGAGYWSDTAIIITWDDWGGWYDHVKPPIFNGPQGSYQYGFRVPMLVVSAYTPKGYVDNVQQDFGSILKFTEEVFGIPAGALGFADARAVGDLSGFFNFQQTPRVFQTIPTVLNLDDFLSGTRPITAPDTD